MSGEVRRKLGLLKAAVLATSGAIIGAIASWLAFGAPRGVDLVADNGNTADWVAAIGTVAVGVGALWFAYEAHRLRLREVAKEEARDLDIEAARLLSISYRLQIAQHPGKVFAGIEIENGRVDCTFVTAALNATLKMFSGLTWSEEEVAILPKQYISTMVGLQVSVTAVRDFGERTLPKCQANRTLSVASPEYAALIGAAATLLAEGEILAHGIGVRLEEIDQRLGQLKQA